MSILAPVVYEELRFNPLVPESKNIYSIAKISLKKQRIMEKIS